MKCSALNIHGFIIECSGNIPQKMINLQYIYFFNLCWLLLSQWQYNSIMIIGKGLLQL